MNNIAGSPDDFRRGYDDAIALRRPSPNSALYLKGYERGVYVREVREAVSRSLGNNHIGCGVEVVYE